MLPRGAEYQARDTAESQQATSRNLGGALPLEAIRAAWPDYEYRIKLDQGTLDLMLVREGQWLEAKGSMKEGEPSAALYRNWLAPEPLRSLDPARVTLMP